MIGWRQVRDNTARNHSARTRASRLANDLRVFRFAAWRRRVRRRRPAGSIPWRAGSRLPRGRSGMLSYANGPAQARHDPANEPPERDGRKCHRERCKHWAIDVGGENMVKEPAVDAVAVDLVSAERDRQKTRTDEDEDRIDANNFKGPGKPTPAADVEDRHACRQTNHCQATGEENETAGPDFFVDGEDDVPGLASGRKQ